MQKDDILIVNGEEAQKILSHKESQIIELVRSAYISHEQDKSSLPYSIFLRFPNQPRSRIIGLPAYLSDYTELAGMKWVASFPDNPQQGIERASALIILNSIKTGRPYGIVEGSIINTKRTAASAVLAASVLSEDKKPKVLGLVGCGPINFEVFRFSMALFGSIQTVYLHDLDSARAEQFATKVKKSGDCEAVIISDVSKLLQKTKLISFATTSATPYLEDPALFQQGSLILHVSLRDLGTKIILNSINVVDDLDHVNRENTSIHLASRETDNTDFVFANIGEVLLEKKVVSQTGKPIIFSPFGLGILDIQLAHFVYEEARKRSIGVSLQNFFPQSWLQR